MKKTKALKWLLCFILTIVLILPMTSSIQAKAAPKLSSKKKTMTVGETYNLTVKNTSKKATFYSSNKGIAKVNKKGTITAKKEGSAIITVKVGSKKLTCKIIVKKASEADEIIKIVNIERRSKGLDELTKNNLLTNAADIRAKEIAKSFSHTRPNGSSCFTAVPSEYKYMMLGENIAMGTASYMNASTVMDLWMNSPGHRANILNSSYNEIGVGIYTTNGCTYYVQVFGRSR